MASSSSRTAYVVGTPELSHFPDRKIALSSHQFEAGLQESVSKRQSPSLEQRGSLLKRFQTRCNDIVGNNAGLLLIACSQAFGSLMIVTVKKLNELNPPVQPLELIWVRMLITWIFSVSYMVLRKVPDPIFGPKEVRWLLLIRGFSGFFGLFGMYYSLQYLSISDAVVLTFLSPMCTAIAGAILLKEHFVKSQAIASLCSLVGVVLIARPQFIFGSPSHAAVPDLANALDEAIIPATTTPGQRLGAVGVAMIGVLGGTGAWTSIRAIGKRAHPMHSLVSFSSQCIIASTIMMLITRPVIVLPTNFIWLAMLVIIGVLGFMGQILMTMGLQRETVGRGTLVVYIQIVFVTILDMVIFQTIPSLLSVLGTVIILSSALFVALNKPSASSDSAQPEDPSLEEGLLANEEEAEEMADMSKSPS